MTERLPPSLLSTADMHFARLINIMIVGSYVVLCGPSSGQNQQIIIPDPFLQQTTSNDTIVVDVLYSTDPPNTKSNGIGFLMHFDSSKLEFDGLENIFVTDLVTTPSPTPQNESEDADGDPRTDKTIAMGWLQFLANNWPNSIDPTLLYRARFRQIGGLLSHTAIRFSKTQTPPGFEFDSAPAVIDNRIDVTLTSALSVDEAATGDFFTILFNKPTPAEGSFTLAIGGTASVGVDFEPIATTLVVPIGVSSKTIPVTLLDDDRVEEDETITITSLDVDSEIFQIAQSPDDRATVAISDNDQSEVKIDTTNMAKEDTVDGQFTLTLSNPVDTDVEVSLSVGGSAAEGSDYANLKKSIIISANENDVTLPISVLSDDIVENDKTVIATLTATDHERVFVSDSPNDSDSLVIKDDDSATISIALSVNAFEEGEANGNFTISMTDSAEFDTTVNYTVTGTATPDSDYTALNGRAILPFDQTSLMLPIVVKEDNNAEGDETVIVTLASTNHERVHIATSPGNTASLVIKDNDITTVGFNLTESLVEEDAGTHQIGIVLSVPEGIQIDNDITVDILSSDGSADPQSDYDEVNEVVVFNEGAIDGTKRSIELTIFEDNVVEGPETIVLELTRISGPALISSTAQRHTVTLSDFVLQLNQGWNLISIPYKPHDPVKTNFVDVAVGKIWSWNTEGRSSFRSLENDEFLTTFSANWIYSKLNTSLRIPGQSRGNQSTTVELQSGWNLFGPTDKVESPYNDKISGEIWYWDKTRYRNIPRNGGNVLELGKGYWINSNEIQPYPP